MEQLHGAVELNKKSKLVVDEHVAHTGQEQDEPDMKQVHDIEARFKKEQDEFELEVERIKAEHHSQLEGRLSRIKAEHEKAVGAIWCENMAHFGLV